MLNVVIVFKNYGIPSEEDRFAFGNTQMEAGRRTPIICQICLQLTAITKGFNCSIIFQNYQHTISRYIEETQVVI